MDINEIKNKIDQIDDQIDDLNNERFRLEQQTVKLEQNKLKCLIGKCFIYGKATPKYCKVVSVPRSFFTASGRFEFNPYQIPIIELDTNDEFGEIFRTTIYSQAVNSDDPIKTFEEEYTPCSSKDFDTKLNEITNKIKEI